MNKLEAQNAGVIETENKTLDSPSRLELMKINAEMDDEDDLNEDQTGFAGTNSAAD